MTRWLVALVLLIGTLIAAAPSHAQTPALTYFTSLPEPLPNCTPGAVGARMPVVWDTTAQAFKYCSATNTWTNWPSTGGTGTACGISGRVQFSAGGGVFDCDAGITFDKATGSFITGGNTNVSVISTFAGQIVIRGGTNGLDGLTIAPSLHLTQLQAHEFGDQLALIGDSISVQAASTSAMFFPTVDNQAGQAFTGLGGSPKLTTWSNPVKRLILPFALCATGATAASAWDTPASNAAVAACKVGGANATVQGVLQFAATQLAYYSGVLPGDWQSWGPARITFTTADTTNGHTVIFNLALACEAANAGVVDDPAYGTANAFTTVTIGGGAVANASYQAATGNLSGGGCAAGSVVHFKLSRATDTSSDTAIAATGWLEVKYNGLVTP